MSIDSGIESGRLRTGRLQQDEWGLLGSEIEDIGEGRGRDAVIRAPSLSKHKKSLGLIGG